MRGKPVLTPRASLDKVLKARRAVRLASGVYKVYSRSHGRAYKVMVYHNPCFDKLLVNRLLMVCECEAGVDRDRLAENLFGLNLDQECVHKLVVARRLLNKRNELLEVAK